MPGDLLGTATEPYRRIEQPGTIQMQRQAVPAREVASRGKIVQRQHPALHGVFQRQQTATGEVKVVRLDRRFDAGKVQRPVRLHFDRLRLNRAQHRCSAAFVFVGVRLLANDVLVTPLAVRHQPQQIAHRPRRNEEPCGRPRLAARRLEQADRRVLAVHVITGRSTTHHFTHCAGGLSDGVAAKIDDGHRSLLMGRADPGDSDSAQQSGVEHLRAAAEQRFGHGDEVVRADGIHAHQAARDIVQRMPPLAALADFLVQILQQQHGARSNRAGGMLGAQAIDLATPFDQMPRTA